jgi:hypothetical protein
LPGSTGINAPRGRAFMSLQAEHVVRYLDTARFEGF